MIYLKSEKAVMKTNSAELASMAEANGFVRCTRVEHRQKRDQLRNGPVAIGKIMGELPADGKAV